MVSRGTNPGVTTVRWSFARSGISCVIGITAEGGSGWWSDERMMGSRKEPYPPPRLYPFLQWSLPLPYAGIEQEKKIPPLM